ncbi:glycosyltransferase [Flaviaesturariibacter aridisoli]|uniref:Glycosyltransferase n=1 Tax=Flaviaesturariibacter aridisoli TaxID=2545761 RepID=A0A4R4E5P4_9BACT|nr:glycosyltransferase [Flaviaesturariibacter aridisoli]
MEVIPARSLCATEPVVMTLQPLLHKKGPLCWPVRKKGRAAQMNWGAKHAKGDVLYFVHADTIPPANFRDYIHAAITEGYDMGRYRTRFESDKWLLPFNEWFTRFDLFICMGAIRHCSSGGTCSKSWADFGPR